MLVCTRPVPSTTAALVGLFLGAAILSLGACSDDEQNTDAAADTSTGNDTSGTDAEDATSESDVPAPDGGTATDDTAQPGPERGADLGEPCPMGCNLELCVDTDSDCESGACVYDGRTGIVAYCSQPCDGVCPAGYDCLEADDDTGFYCFTQPAVCGDGAQQYGEACDDGNTDSRDFCAPNCSAVTTIPSWGRFQYGQPGFEPVVREGDEPFVYGYLRTSGEIQTLVLGTSTSTENVAVEIRDITNLAPQSGLLFTMYADFYPCNFSGISGNGLTITEFDPEEMQIAGEFSAGVACLSGCFDCGGDGSMRTFEGSFDIHYIVDPNQ